MQTVRGFWNTVAIRVASYVRRIVVIYYRRMGVRIEGHVFISHGAHIDTTVRGRITICDGCVITRGAVILAHDQSFARTGRSDLDKGVGSVVLGKNVFVGVNAITLPGVTVGENSVIGAGAVVTRDVPRNVIVVGVPARVMRTIQ